MLTNFLKPPSHRAQCWTGRMLSEPQPPPRLVAILPSRIWREMSPSSWRCCYLVSPLPAAPIPSPHYQDSGAFWRRPSDSGGVCAGCDNVVPAPVSPLRTPRQAALIAEPESLRIDVLGARPLSVQTSYLFIWGYFYSPLIISVSFFLSLGHLVLIIFQEMRANKRKPFCYEYTCILKYSY